MLPVSETVWKNLIWFFYWIGPILIWVSLVRRMKKIEEYQTEKADFFKQYQRRTEEIEGRRGAHLSADERMAEFLRHNQGAVLRRAPRDAREFEIIVANWLRLWGEIDAEVTQFTGDGGLDVVSEKIGAQVKFYSNKPVGRPEVQGLYGAAVGSRLQPAFFAYSTGYTQEALDWAADVGVACFTFVPDNSDPNLFIFEAHTEPAAELALRAEGLSYADWLELSDLEEKRECFGHELPLSIRPENKGGIFG